MESEAFMAWGVRPGLWIAVLSMASLAGYVMFDLVRRVPTSQGRTRALWLGGSALALGTGLWSTHFIGLAGDASPIGIGYGGLLALLAWGVAVAASAAPYPQLIGALLSLPRAKPSHRVMS